MRCATSTHVLRMFELRPSACFLCRRYIARNNHPQTMDVLTWSRLVLRHVVRESASNVVEHLRYSR